MFFLILILFFIFFNITEESTIKEKRFTEKEIKIAKYNTVMKLNDVQFPSSESNFSYKEEHLNTYYNFTYYFFRNLNYTSFSPISLYSI